MNGEFIIVTDEQAKVLEASGVKVEIVQIVRVANLAAKPAAPEAPQPAARPNIIKSARGLKYPKHMVLRWTGLKWTGKPNTQLQAAYVVLADYFNGRDVKKVLTREDVNKLLVKELAKKNIVFSSSIVTYLCNQKYLEPSQQVMGL